MPSFVRESTLAASALDGEKHMVTTTSRLSRRTCLRLAGLGALGALAPGFVRRSDAAAAKASLPARGTHLVLLGTQGGPNFSAERAETSSAVVVDGTPYLIDMGTGAMLAIRKAGINIRNVGQLFLTHLHDDHVAEVGAFLSHQWTDGRVTPTVVRGPYGTADLVANSLRAFEANAAIRIADEARKVLPADLFRGEDLAATTEPVQVYKDEHITVTSVENTHYPAAARSRMPHRSLSFRFDCPGRSIVFSGDTAYSSALVKLAQGADVFVCEATDADSMRRDVEARVKKGAYADNPEGILAHILGAHTTTAEAGRMAAEAKVGMLVLNHLAPGALQPVKDSTYIKGVREHFAGKVVVGKDLMVL